MVITWDREEYIVNNDSLPTVCGMLRVTPTERNITVTVSFEAGDMAGMMEHMNLTGILVHTCTRQSY